jgi:SNF2 family DNA or RNA helicase
MTNETDKQAFLEDIERRLVEFGKLIDRSGMERKKYQEDGVRWCLTNELRHDPPAKVRGGFIADEMGLGKTIMMIGLFVANMMPRNLIILPPILIEQWVNQIQRMTGHTPIVFHGKNKKNITISLLQQAPIVISTYNTISIIKNKITPLHEVKWNRIVFDEGHHLRNSKTNRLLGATLLKGKIRYIVSGTPIQNKKQDFYNLCKVIKMPASFYTNPDNLMTIARNFILKRTKKSVGICLPDVVHNNQVVMWQNIKERELSEGIHAVLGMAALDKIDAVGEAIIAQGSHVFRALMRSKQTCILPKMLTPMFDDFVRTGIMNNYDDYKEALSYSSKLDTVVNTILTNKGNGCGKLVFCHFHEEIDQLRQKLQDGGIDKIACFDGRLNQTFRQQTLDEGYEVLILQIQTGCEGLNLQEKYSEIYFVSPHWNPAVEDQAIARCHRIGQTKDVKVYRFNMENFDITNNNEKTLDNHILRVQGDKRTIADSVIHTD